MCPKYLKNNRKDGDRGSILLAASVPAHRSSRCSQRGVVPGSRALLRHCSVLGHGAPLPLPPLTPLSPTQPPRLPALLCLRQMGRGAGHRGKHTPLLPQLPQRQRGGEPGRRDPRLTPPPPFPITPETLSSFAGPPPGQPVFLLHRCRGAAGDNTHSRPPLLATGGAARPARWLQPPCHPHPPTPPLCPRQRSQQLQHPGFIPQCLLAPYFIT